MKTSTIEYQGELHTLATHCSSGKNIQTDAPVDNGGRGEAFSPTDLLATALGACAITIVGKAALKHGFDVDGTKISVTKVMDPAPRRVGKVILDFYFPPVEYTQKQQDIIIRSVKSCPVSLSLHPDIKQEFNFHFNDTTL